MLSYSEEELRALQAEITDPNFRIFADADTITVFNSERFVRGTDIQAIFAQLDVDDPAHAFYLGKELAKASLAVTLGKTYRQEGALAWGYLTPPDDARSEHVRLTQRPRRPRSGAGVRRRSCRDQRPRDAARRGADARRRIRCGAASSSRACRTACSSTAPRRATRLGRYSFLTADPIAVIEAPGRATRSTRCAPGSRRSHRRADRRACRRFRAESPATSPTTGACPSNVCPHRATTISRCPTSCSASTTGCSPGTTSPRAPG